MFKKESIIIALILAIAIPLLNFLGQISGYTALWPGFFVVLLYFIGRCEKLSDLKNIFVGGLVGILWSWLVSLLIGVLDPYIGFLAAFTIAVAISVFILAALMDWQPMFFNNYAFIYYLTAALFVEQKPIEWMASLLIAGSIFAILVIGGIKFFIKPSEE